MSGPLLLAAAFLTIVWMVAGVQLVAILLAALFVVMAIVAATRPGEPLVRQPKPPGRGQWALGLGVGLTHHGPFPFVTVYRRRRF